MEPISLIFLSVVGLLTLQLVLAAVQRPKRAGGRKASELHLNRRFQHALTGLAFFCLSYVLPPSTSSFLLIAASAALLAFNRLSLRSDSAMRAYQLLFGSLLRPHEREGNLPGAFYFLLGTAVCALAFQMDVARLSLLCLSIGDPFAAVVGTTIGGAKLYRGGGASFAGSGACLIVSFGLGVWGMKLTPSESAISATSATIAEALAPLIGVDDNLIMPVATGSALSLFRFIKQ